MGLALAEKEVVDLFVRGRELGVGLDPGRHGRMWQSERGVRLEAETWSPEHQVYGAKQPRSLGDGEWVGPEGTGPGLRASTAQNMS